MDSKTVWTNKMCRFSLIIIIAVALQPFLGCSSEAADKSTYEHGSSSQIKDKGAKGETCRLNQVAAPSPLLLTDEQLRKWVELKDNFEIAVANKKAELHSLNHKISERMTDDNSDRKEIEQLQERILTLNQEISRARFQFSLNVMEALTAEQKRKLKFFLLSANAREAQAPMPMLPMDRASFIGYIPGAGHPPMPAPGMPLIPMPPHLAPPAMSPHGRFHHPSPDAMLPFMPMGPVPMGPMPMGLMPMGPMLMGPPLHPFAGQQIFAPTFSSAPSATKAETK